MTYWRRIGLLVLGLAAWGCTLATPTTAQWDEVAARDVRAQVESTMNAFVSMDLETFRAGLAEDVVAYEMDLENRQLRLGSRDEVIRWAAAEVMSNEVTRQTVWTFCRLPGRRLEANKVIPSRIDSGILTAGNLGVAEQVLAPSIGHDAAIGCDVSG